MPTAPASRTAASVLAARDTAPASDVVDRSPAFFLCLALGVVCLGVGVWFLLNPAAPMSASARQLAGLGLGVDTSGVVNLQRLTIGETCTVAGAVFLATALRPFVR